MDKINFQNGVTKVNADTFNTFQNNIDNGKINTELLTDVYSNMKTYEVGSYCIYNNQLYKCTTAILTGETFNSAHWSATTIENELKNRLEFEVVETW